MPSRDSCRCGRDKRRSSKRKCLCGIGCILIGLVIMICCSPGWLLALIVAMVLIGVGVALCGYC